MYKEQNKNRVAKTTQKKKWLIFDKYLEKAKDSLDLKQSNNFVSTLLTQYSGGTLKAIFTCTLYPCVNQAVKQNLIDNNPYQSIPLPKSQKQPIECFEPNEIKAIIAAFYSNEFVSINSRYKHSWYAKYVEFLALTGCRPEEAIPLTWDDVKEQNGKMFIRFNKAYSHKILLAQTKTHTIRLFPCNNQLQKLINSIPRLRYPNKLNLLFPSQTYDYITQNNFTSQRYWKKVVYGLVKQGKVSQYLKPYCLRHSFITRLVRDGVDPKTIATLVGTSVVMIVSHYLASRKDFDLPEL